MKTSLYVIASIFIILISIQFIGRPEKINKPITDQDIKVVLQINADMSAFLTSSCYDCHSDQPQYPWYFDYAPMRWTIAKHIKEGRNHLNFSEWGNYSAQKQAHKLEELLEEVASKHMPLAAYLTMHQEARMTDEKLERLRTWVQTELNKIDTSSTDAN